MDVESMLDTEGIFIQTCREKGYTDNEILQFQKAIAIARNALEGRKRLSGEPYIEHNIRVGSILAENRAGPEVVLAGLLHDLPSATGEIAETFGREVFALVQGVEEIKNVKRRSTQLDAESLRRIILTTLKDVRIILVKLANKLDNMRTISNLLPEDQRRVAEEVLEVYAPLAYRLGAEKIRNELEDRAFKIINFRKYSEITNFFRESKEKQEEDIKKVISEIKRLCSNTIPLLTIKARYKHVYSIYKKIKKRGVGLKDLYDLFGVRVIVPEEKDCYTMLGLLHEHFVPIPGRLKDYITNPKPNFYRSLHTGIRLPDGTAAEIQIRTPEMDEFAEEGIAAHWHYKGLLSDNLFEKKVAWLRGILDLQKDAKDKEFLEAAKVDIFGDEIYCYTPKGDMKQLPLGATILDFAYAVHEEVGNCAIGGRVNGTFVPLRHLLSQGDVVEVLTNKKQRPRRSWLKIIRSARAKQKIRKSLKDHEKLPALHFRQPKPTLSEEQGLLAESLEFPKASCILAKCCQPLPGQAIAGIITKKHIISIHAEDCRHALKEQERWVAVQWKTKFAQKIRFFVHAGERSGLLADLLHTIARAGFEVREAKAKLLDAGSAECSFTVIPRDLEELKELMSKVQNVKGVKKIYFE